MARKRIKKPPMSNINVVPYIDVMLVLLVIFMITTPLLSEGVKVELPQASAKPLPPTEKKPIVVTVDAKGLMYVDIRGDEAEKPIDDETLISQVAAALRQKPDTQVVVKGDKNVEYGSVVYTMTLLQKAGAPSVGLMTETPSDSKK